MISKENRFTTHNFERLRKRMKSFRAGNFLFLWSFSPQKSKVAIVISKKIEKTAVGRNQLRRRAYEIFRKDFLPQYKNINVIALYKGESIPNSASDISKAVQQLSAFLQRKASDKSPHKKRGPCF